MPEFAHLLPRERRIWSLFIRDHGAEFDSLVYDTHVGEGLPVSENNPDPWVRMAKHLSQKRIDALGRKGQVIWLIEVKPHLGVTAMGALRSYEPLYRQTTGYTGAIQLALVGETVDFDLEKIWRREGVAIFRYPLG